MANETAYEAIYILDAALPDDQQAAVVNKYRDIIERGGGTIDDIDRGEPRRLAYEIKGRREGVYVVKNFRSDVPTKNELDRIFRISDDVIRYLILKQDPKADRFPSQTRQAEQERREREAAARAAAYPSAASQQAAQQAQQAQPVTDLGAPANSPVATVPGTDAAPESATDADPNPVLSSPDTGAAAPEVANTEETAADADAQA
jgi:small subunit ribosomal protein S6